MITLALAQRLKDEGLVWTPKEFDFFAVPDVGLDDRVFVLHDMSVELTVRSGWPVISFNGTVEWALDYVLQTDAVWLPTEEQLRHLLQMQLASAWEAALSLVCEPLNFVCRVQRGDEVAEYAGIDASEAYGLALLDTLGNGEG